MSYLTRGEVQVPTTSHEGRSIFTRNSNRSSARIARRWAASAIATGAVFAAVLAPAAANAAARITGLKVTNITGSSFSVSLNSMGSGFKYKLFASTNKSQIYYS